jgi:hypothetical protein
VVDSGGLVVVVIGAFGGSDPPLIASGADVFHTTPHRAHPTSRAPLPNTRLPFPAASPSCTQPRHARRFVRRSILISYQGKPHVITTQTLWPSWQATQDSWHPALGTAPKVGGRAPFPAG